MRLGFTGAARPVVLELGGGGVAETAGHVRSLAHRWPQADATGAADVTLQDGQLTIHAYEAPILPFDGPLAAANGAVGGLIGALVVQQAETLALHAASYRAASGMVVLLGDHGAGKSTLAAALAQAGAPLAGDDRLVITRDGAGWHGRALGLRPKLRWPLPAEAPPAFAGMVAARTVAAEGGMRLVDLPGVLDFGVTARLAALVLLRRDGSVPVLEPLPRAALVKDLVGTLFAPHVAPAARLALMASLAALPGYTLRYNSAFAAASHVLERFPP
jgi:hypothetical protein